MDEQRASGVNGYLASGDRVQVPSWFTGGIFVVRRLPQLDMAVADPESLLPVTEHLLRRRFCLWPPGVLGPLEGDGSWVHDDLTEGRIVTLWLEDGAPILGRLQRSPR